MATDEMGLDISRDMYAKAVGDLVLNYVDTLRPYELSPIAESGALKLISQIKAILDEGDTGDSECFHRIDEIVNAFYESGIYTSRHDW